MARIRIDLPENFNFHVTIPLRITDLNYGGHVGNDTVLSLIHQARLAFLESLGYNELNLAGAGLIMADVAINFKKELFYPGDIKVWVKAGDFSRAGFDLFYKIEVVNETSQTQTAVEAKTGMICFNYTTRKVTGIPAEALEKLGG